MSTDCSSTGGPDVPAEVGCPAQFVAAMRGLKAGSGLSYRDLERRAAGAGEFLPRSTLLNALTRDTLPKSPLVAAFVRACGRGPDDVAAWLTAHHRLTVAGAAAPASTVPRTGVDAPRRAPLGAVLLAVLALVTAATVGAFPGRRRR